MSEDLCLHCRIAKTIRDFYDERDERAPDGKVMIDVPTTLAKLADAAVELIVEVETRAQRRAAMKFLHDAIDGAWKSHLTGRPVEVTTQVETEH